MLFLVLPTRHGFDLAYPVSRSFSTQAAIAALLAIIATASDIEVPEPKLIYNSRRVKIGNQESFLRTRFPMAIR